MSGIDFSEFAQLSGVLFEEVMMSDVFEDEKDFCDSVMRMDPVVIRERYREEGGMDGFEVERFVRECFDMPGVIGTDELGEVGSGREYVSEVWSRLIREGGMDGEEGGTRIGLPERCVVPGDRFREMYYWDTYFTCEGLVRDGYGDVVSDVADNFAFLIDEYGFIPNANRVYYLTRSQPPLFYRIVGLVDEYVDGRDVGEFLPGLVREYEFWMRGMGSVEGGESMGRVVNVGDGVVNRYWDELSRPRFESFSVDRGYGEEVPVSERGEFYRDVRAACESGWDFSTRWLSDSSDFGSIETTSLVPVDLNCLLWEFEQWVVDWFEREGVGEYVEVDVGDFVNQLQVNAECRREVIEGECWNSEIGTYVDYHWEDGRSVDRVTAATVLPLFVGLAGEERAGRVVETVKEELLCSGGVLTTAECGSYQWDGPNGWPPLQFFTVRGLERYGYDELAEEVACRWLGTVDEWFAETGVFHEKYRVDGGGEVAVDGNDYSVQVGFGWTNGVYAVFDEEYR